MNKRDFLATLIAGEGITFLSTRLFNQYKNNRLSFTELPKLDPFNQNTSISADELMVETMPTEADLQEGFKHSERQILPEEIEQMEDEQVNNYLEKIRNFDGDFAGDIYLSETSRSLAPPGYSFHGIGDFDVGKIGLGEANFTIDFSNTEEFQRLITLGYVDIRYTDTNRFGVRYEPWHIKII